MVHCYGLHRWAWQRVLASVATGFWITCCSTVRATLPNGGRLPSLDGTLTMENQSAGRHELVSLCHWNFTLASRQVCWWCGKMVSRMQWQLNFLWQLDSEIGGAQWRLDIASDECRWEKYWSMKSRLPADVSSVGKFAMVFVITFYLRINLANAACENHDSSVDT